MSNELQVIPRRVNISKTQSLDQMFELWLNVGGPYAQNTIRSNT